jgi:hypothetical protein
VRAAYLIAAVVLGVLVYVGAVALLWVLSGRPDSAEVVMGRRVVSAARQATGKVRSRLGAATKNPAA